MFGKKETKIVTKTNKVDSLISKGTKVMGPIDITGTLKVYGEVIGNITGPNKNDVVIIDKGARVVGDVKADVVIIAGHMIGNVYAGSVFLQASAEIGLAGFEQSSLISIDYDIIQIDPGAKLYNAKLIKNIPQASNVIKLDSEATK